jgi:hypothetical protein
MPVHKGKDSRGTFYQWGKSGKKYRGRGAKARAEKQAKAIYASGYKER